MRFYSRSLFMIIAGAMILATGCATTGPVTAARIRAEMSSIKNDIAANRSSMNMLKDRRVGKTGFYYIMDAEGTVVFHPRPALIGNSFRDHWFVKQILTEKAGCLTYQLGNRTHVIFYEQLNDEETLCLSIVSDDFSQLPVDCRPAVPK
jgi:hypothetical protein